MNYKEYREFRKKVENMNAYDIIMAMVNGLRNPRTKINMRTFGEIREGICYGCAATNAILHIMEVKKDEVVGHILECESHTYRPLNLSRFENAIDHLRRGNVTLYNSYASEVSFSQITPMPGQELPYLDNDYTEAQLQEYVKLAEYQLTIKTTKK